MATTSQFYRSNLNYNMVTDPKKLPLWLGSGVNAPYIDTGTRTWAYGSNSTFWSTFDTMGTRTWSSVASSYVAILNLSSLSNPVIMGTVVGRHPATGGTSHKIKITVDGRETIIAPSTTFNGRFVLGGLNNQAEADTGYGTLAGGMRFLFFNAYGDASDSYAYGTGFVEHPMDMLVHGMPVLFAEDSLKVEIWDDNVNAAGYDYYAGVTWCTLEGF